MSETVTSEQAIRIAFRAYENGDEEQAEKRCLRILEGHTHLAEAHLLLGLIEEKKGHLSIAERMFSVALDITPGFSTALKCLKRIQDYRKESRAHSYVQLYFNKRPVYMDYPRNIGIETVGYCNAKCVFCPHSILDRNGKRMSDDLFMKILKDIQGIPPHVPTNIFPNLVNEPFMDKDIFKRLRMINDYLPHTSITIFTNFNVLPKDFFEHIWTVKNILYINVSLNSSNAVDYEDTMHIDFKKTIDNIKLFMKGNQKYRLAQRPLVLSRIANISHKDKQFIDECKEIFSDFKYDVDYQLKVKNRTDWLASVDANYTSDQLFFPCGAWLDINIFCTGLVPFCCMDAKGEYAIGDINKNSILEVYNGRSFRKYRETMVYRETAYPCNTCCLLQ